MPPIIQKKKPGILTWVIIGAIVIFSLAVIKSVLFETSPSTTQNTLGYAGGMDTAYAPPAADVAYERQSMPESGMMATKDYASNESAVPATEPTEPAQRVIKTGDLSLLVQDALKATEDAKRIAVSKSGYIEASGITDKGAGPRSGWLTIRVPSATFEETLSELKALSVLVINESVRGQDVTMQYVDLEADLKNAQAEEASYLEIMKRSGKIEEVLMVAQRLAEVRGRIERLDGQKRYLENLTDLATITVSLTEETKIEIPSRTWRPYEVFRSSIREIIIALQALVDILIRLVIGIIGLLIPIVLIISLFMWIFWKIIRTVIKRLKK
ncbi:MAG: DUF4349 domain-containing protein [Patescibacteria group bacterium]